MILEGQGELTSAAHGPVPFEQGDTILLPPHLDTQVAVTRDAQWLEVRFPQAQNSRLA